MAIYTGKTWCTAHIHGSAGSCSFFHTIKHHEGEGVHTLSIKKLPDLQDTADQGVKNHQIQLHFLVSRTTKKSQQHEEEIDKIKIQS